jgi:hypothetical protein
MKPVHCGTASLRIGWPYACMVATRDGEVQIPVTEGSRSWMLGLVAVWLGAHVITVPALALSSPVTESPLPVEAEELAAHVMYGLVVEFLRRSLRRWMLRG